MNYLDTQEFGVEVAVNLADALKRIQEKRFNLIIVDMEIPGGGAVAAITRTHSPLATKYLGMVAVVQSLSKGYRAGEVVVLTVHDDDAADAELAKYGCRYVLKGRPEVLKQLVRTLVARSAGRGKNKSR